MDDEGFGDRVRVFATLGIRAVPGHLEAVPIFLFAVLAGKLGVSAMIYRDELLLAVLADTAHV